MPPPTPSLAHQLARTRVLHAIAAIAAAAICAAAALAATAIAYRGPIVRSVENGGDWYARSPGWYTTRGVYPTEHTPDGAPFAWAGGRVRLQIPQLDRASGHRLSLRIRSGREADAVLRVLVDGIDAAIVRAAANWQTFDVAIPPSKQTGVIVLIDAESTFTPGPQDARRLAFMLDRLALEPTKASRIVVGTPTYVHVAAFAGGVALALILCGLPPWLALASGVAPSLAAIALVRFDAAYLGGYSAVLVPLAIATVVLGGLGAIVRRFAPADLRRAAAAAVALAALVSVLKLAVFLHPAAPTSDGMFHVHRAQAVRGGEYLFTSVTPRPFYEFPYPIGLYVAAQPFWTHVDDRVALLRGITIAADGLVAIAIFAAVAVRTGSRFTGLIAAALALAVPVVEQSISTANLTNVFGQSLFSLAVLWMGWRLRSRHTAIAAAVAALLLAAAYLSHFSTAVIGMPAAVAIAGATAFARDDRDARAWRWIALAVAAALVLSYAFYYSHFHDVYARTLSRVGSEGASNSFVATLSEHSESKAMTMLRFVFVNYGWGALLLAALGVAAALRRDRRDGWTLQLAAFATIVTIFLLLGAFTPVEMRANLAAHPLVAIFAALGFAVLWESRRTSYRVAALACAAATVWSGLSSARALLG
jgi:hypothetical protein